MIMKILDFGISGYPEQFRTNTSHKTLKSIQKQGIKNHQN